MPQIYRANGFAAGRSVVKLALVAAASFGASEMAVAADHRVSAGADKFSCSSTRPGDTITLASGTRGPLTIHNCKGTASNPIIIRNDPQGSGPTIIRRQGGSHGGFVFSCNSCTGVEIDGSYKWRGAPSGKTYGIKLTMSGSKGPTAFLRLGGLSRFVTVRNVEVDGTWPGVSNGVGMFINDHKVKRSSGQWREGILLEHNYVHNVAREGLYVGPNYNEGAVPLRNIEIRYNRVEEIGWEGINTKSMWSGQNSIHHNVVRRTGLNTSNSKKRSQYSGISNTSGTVEIYNNWVESTGQHGIQVWTQEGPRASEGRGPFDVQIWNNVVVNAGGLWRPFMQDSFGISVGAQNGMEKPIPHVYNNTIVNSRQTGINLSGDVGGGLVRDNVIAGAGGSPVRAPAFVNLINNRTGSVSQMSFVDAGRSNFRPSNNSPARNQGSDVFPRIDFDGVTRPKEGKSDQGAYEGN
jgi:hypothetical protein